MGIEPTL